MQTLMNKPKGKNAVTDQEPKVLENSSSQTKAVLLKWFYAEGEKDDNGKVLRVKKLTINLYPFSRFLKKLGFYRFDKDRESFTVRIQDNIVEVCLITNVIDAVLDYINDIPGNTVFNGSVKIKKEVLLNKLYAGLSTYFSENILNRCRKKGEFLFLEDTKDKAYFFFNNCIIEVNHNNINTIKYESVKDRYIWKDQILLRDFKQLKIKDFIDSPFSKFSSNVSNLNKEIKGSKYDEARFQALQNIIGYSLHKYFQGKLKAVIFTDSTLSDEPNGRTGKTLLSKAIGKVLNTDEQAKTFVELNGKDFKFENPKRYQECDLDTRLVHINDAIRNFRFELLFNDISEGIKAVHHYKAPFLVNAKIIISTNRTIKIPGNSGKDRCVEFEMSNHYGINHSPEKEFGHWFFRDWNKTQWLQFDNFMVFCVKQYLENGLTSPKSINLNKRKLNEETAREFVLFMDEYLEKDKNERHDKSDIYETFIEQFPDFNKSLTQRTFTTWCRKYVIYDKKYLEAKEERSGGKSYIKFIKKAEESRDG